MEGGAVNPSADQALLELSNFGKHGPICDVGAARPGALLPHTSNCVRYAMTQPLTLVVGDHAYRTCGAEDTRHDALAMIRRRCRFQSIRKIVFGSFDGPLGTWTPPIGEVHTSKCV
jgi:hypothetical protein